MHQIHDFFLFLKAYKKFIIKVSTKKSSLKVEYLTPSINTLEYRNRLFLFFQLLTKTYIKIDGSTDEEIRKARKGDDTIGAVYYKPNQE